MKKFFVTTPIYYINDVPHIGHAYATFAADILARFNRALGNETFFLTGTDENSQKTVLAAQAAGKEIKVYTDELASKWKSTWKKLDISNDDFIRTTEKRHKKVVSEIFQKINKNGDLYKGKYEGLYCVGHEAFLKGDDLDEKGLCPDHQTKPEQIVEENYFFKLSKYQGRLIEHFDNNPKFVEPKERYNEILNFIKAGLQDISVTRETQKWGIPAPNDPKQVIYVWFDALINYISADPSKWPVDVHIIGKDILRFHACFWPAMLLSAGYELPKKVFAHGFFTVNGKKISKSLGNAIDPLAISEKYGVEALRYYLFKEIPFGNDGDFSFKRLEEVYNADLANGLGNLVARVAKLCETAGLETKPQSEKVTFPADYKTALEELRFQDALSLIWSKITKVDREIDQSKPWELINKDTQAAKALLTTLVEEIRGIQTLLIPFLPETTEKIAQQFAGPKIQSAKPLFPRINLL
ncbi:MAG: methionine--tRNA ligase [Candidatus Woykebacteria bacterium GWB1_45_5]|uniref:Methionine--tRNA ligase n=2 Tax=Candidatus Woykeibacteriota TaxID=1817899 RepID=A0A1G1W0R7_9BACT|nr:MAG: methionine--tRNA ligase [Candidatus Woykebacteria bacterium GWA1_44_8]OGY24573.1 MAG: methionine--tRNA ligase [Candidatus Woykebacteria bacterium GWB1_45_5]